MRAGGWGLGCTVFESLKPTKLRTVGRALDPGLPLQGQNTIFELPVTALPPPVTSEGRLPVTVLSPGYQNKVMLRPTLVVKWKSVSNRLSVIFSPSDGMDWQVNGEPSLINSEFRNLR